MITLLRGKYCLYVLVVMAMMRDVTGRVNYENLRSVVDHHVI